MTRPVTRPVTRRAEGRTARRTARWIVRGALAVAAIAACVTLRPVALGGNVGFVKVAGTSMLPTMKDGDLVFTWRTARYRVGDVVAYRVPKGEAAAGAHVIHRIIGGNARDGYQVQGDNRKGPDYWRPHPDDVIGRRWVRLPGGGALLSILASPLGVALLATGVTLWIFFEGEDDPSEGEGSRTDRATSRRRRRASGGAVGLVAEPAGA